jgi:hypothetical protein
VEHRVVLRHHRADEASDPALLRGLDQPGEEDPTDPPSLPLVHHRDRELRGARVVDPPDEARGAQPLDLTGAGAPTGCEREVRLPVDLREVRELPIREPWLVGEEPPEAGLLREVLEARGQDPLVLGPEGLEEHQATIPEADGLTILRVVDPLCTHRFLPWRSRPPHRRSQGLEESAGGRGRPS